jgi:hypothetical protein
MGLLIVAASLTIRHSVLIPIADAYGNGVLSVSSVTSAYRNSLKEEPGYSTLILGYIQLSDAACVFI